MRTSELKISQFEQRENINFWQILVKPAAEMFEMMQQVYGDDSLSLSVDFRLHRLFLQGRDNLEDDVRTGWPQTVRTERKIR